MFNLFNKKKEGEKVEIKLTGLHCTSCALSVDDALEDLDGVFDANTNYAKSTSTIYFDPQKISLKKITETIQSLGYAASEALNG